MVLGHYYFAGGPASVVVLLLTALSLFVIVVAAVLSALVKNALLPLLMAIALFVNAFIIVSIGTGATLVQRAKVNAAVVGVDPSMQKQLLEEGMREAGQPMTMALLGGGLPGLAAVGLVFLAMKRRADASSSSAAG